MQISFAQLNSLKNLTVSNRAKVLNFAMTGAGVAAVVYTCAFSYRYNKSSGYGLIVTDCPPRNLHLRPLFSSSFSIGFILAMLNPICGGRAQEVTAPTPVWNGERRALTSQEKLGSYLSVGSVTCHKPATSNGPEQYFHGTGQITLTKDVVTTAAHNFIDHSTCRPWAVPWTCEFRMEDRRSYAIDMSRSRFGFSMRPEDWRGQSPGNCKTEKADSVKDDWAVLKLDRQAQDAIPYQIREMNSAAIDSTGEVVTEIAGYTQSFLKNGQETPSVENCRLEGRSPVGGSAKVPLLLAGCGGGPGTSGSGLYTGNNGIPSTSKLIAIYHGPLLGHGARTSLYVPIAGSFLSQIKAVASQQ